MGLEFERHAFSIMTIIFNWITENTGNFDEMLASPTLTSGTRYALLYQSQRKVALEHLHKALEEYGDCLGMAQMKTKSVCAEALLAIPPSPAKLCDYPGESSIEAVRGLLGRKWEQQVVQAWEDRNHTVTTICGDSPSEHCQYWRRMIRQQRSLLTKHKHYSTHEKAIEEAFGEAADTAGAMMGVVGEGLSDWFGGGEREAEEEEEYQKEEGEEAGGDSASGKEGEGAEDDL